MTKKIKYVPLKLEFKKPVCKYGVFCEYKTSTCHLDHNTNKHIMCKFGLNCKRKVCYFAHNDKELIRAKCKYNIECKRKDCRYAHDEKKEINIKEEKEFEMNTELFPQMSNETIEIENIESNEFIVAAKREGPLNHHIFNSTEKSIDGMIEECNKMKEIYGNRITQYNFNLQNIV